MRYLIPAIVAVSFVANPIQGEPRRQESPATEQRTEIRKQLEKGLRYIDQIAGTQKDAQDPVAESRKQDELASLRAELANLRAQVDVLQETLDIYLGGIVADLQAENSRLRAELRELFALRSGGRQTQTDGSQSHQYTGPGPVRLPQHPAAASRLSEKTLREIRSQEQAALSQAFGETADGKSPGYTVIAQWGRTPEEAAALGNAATSLKGLICVAQSGMTKAELSNLAQRLRAAFDEYDNLNIEVFDNAAAATQYADSNVNDEDHHVISISKHKKSGHDEILIFHGDKATRLGSDE